MAKLNGVEIKRATIFTGHDGGGYYYATVYVNGKSKGKWSMDPWCGPDHFDRGLEDAIRQACKAWKNSLPDNYQYKEWADSPEILMNILLGIYLCEKEVKKLFKRGCTAVVVRKDKRGHSLTGYTSGRVPKVKDGETILYSPNLDIVADETNPAPDWLL